MKNKKIIKQEISNRFIKIPLICYNSFYIDTYQIPDIAIAQRTVECLQYVFPYIKIELGEEFKIIIEDKPLNKYSAHINIEERDHDDYIKEIMIELFSIYDTDEQKMPKKNKMYNWYFKLKNSE